MYKKNDFITTGYFIGLIWKTWQDVQKTAEIEQGVSKKEQYNCLTGEEEVYKRGRQMGWLEEQDVLFDGNLLERKSAARIIHEFLRKECKESDEVDVKSASELKDLYDCRVCAGHIAQVYAKGIMDKKELSGEISIFGLNDNITGAESFEIVGRMFSEKRRRDYAVTTKSRAAKIDFLQAKKILETQKSVLIDVRTPDEYAEKHLENAINIPMMRILESETALIGVLEKAEYFYYDSDIRNVRDMSNISNISNMRDISILLYCNLGYQSEIAANRLSEYGFTDICYFGYEMGD